MNSCRLALLRLHSCLYILCLVISPCQPCAAQTNTELPEELGQMVGKSAEQLCCEHEQTLQSLAEQAHPTRSGAYWLPRDVWKFNTAQNEVRYVAFLISGITHVPSGNTALIVLLTSGGSIIKSWCVPSGWRLAFKSATLAYDDVAQTQVISAVTKKLINGQDVVLEHFALMDETLYFIRAENSQGRLIRNRYDWDNLTLGVGTPAKTVDEWLALLSSPQPPRRLAALTYLAGIHASLEKPDRQVLPEAMAEARTARALREQESTQKLIDSYRHSKNAWLKEAAELAATAATDEG